MGRPARLDNTPTPERLAKGDVGQYTPREYHPETKKMRELPPVHRVRRSNACPLSELLGRRSINRDEYDAGRRLGSAYERATRETGAINLDSLGGGWNGGISHARCEAMDELTAMRRAIGDTEHDRKVRMRVLIAVCAEGRSLREYVGGGGRACQTASNILVVSLQRLVRMEAL